MTTLDELFAADLAAQTGAVAEPDMGILEARVLSGARRQRRVRVGVNTALTVVASAVVAAGAWASIHTATPPVSNPTPTPSLIGALPDPSLSPVWNGSLRPAPQPVPAAFADEFDVSALTPIEPPSRNYPQAYAIADWVWDEVSPGWSLQTWDGDGTEDPNNLYLVSPGGTYFLVDELDYFAGDEHWSVESWSAAPARAVILGQDVDNWTASRQLVDLRTGETMRVWGATPDGGTAAEYTVLGTGFEGGRSVQLEFSKDDGYFEDDAEPAPDGEVVVRIVSPDGTSVKAVGDGWHGAVPTVTGLGGDSRTALVQDGSEHVLTVDLESAVTRAVTLKIPDGQTCQGLALGPSASIVAYCYVVDNLATYATRFDGATGALLESEPVADSFFAVQGFDGAGGALVDRANGAVIDASGFASWDSNVELTPIGDGLFSVTDTMPQHHGLVLYDRPSGASSTVAGVTVRGSQAFTAVSSVVVLADVVPGETGLIMGATP